MTTRRERIKTLETIPPDASNEEFIASVDRNELRIEEALKEFPDDEELLVLLDLTKAVRLVFVPEMNLPEVKP